LRVKKFLPLLVSVLFLGLMAIFLAGKLTGSKDPNRYHSKFVKLSFDTNGVNYLEKIQSEPNSKGKSVQFSGEVIFDAIEKGSLCKSYLGNVVGCGEVNGNIDNADTLNMSFGIKEYKKVIDLGDNVYLLIQQTNSECSPSVESQLLVKPPASSKFKIIEFWPITMSFNESEMKVLCEPKAEAILSKMKSLENWDNPKVEALMEQQIKVARSFKF
jgi:hypothetical protein